MKKILIKEATLINEGRTYVASVLIENDKIAAIYEGAVPSQLEAIALWHQ